MISCAILSSKTTCTTPFHTRLRIFPPTPRSVDALACSHRRTSSRPSPVVPSPPPVFLFRRYSRHRRHRYRRPHSSLFSVAAPSQARDNDDDSSSPSPPSSLMCEIVAETTDGGVGIDRDRDDRNGENMMCENRSPLPTTHELSASDIDAYLEEVERLLTTSHAGAPSFRRAVGSVYLNTMIRTLLYEGWGEGDVEKNACAYVGGESGPSVSSSAVRSPAKSPQRRAPGSSASAGAASRKVEFSRRLRDERASFEHERMVSFVSSYLRPAALALEDSVRKERAPELIERIDRRLSLWRKREDESEANGGKGGEGADGDERDAPTFYCPRGQPPTSKGWANFSRLASGKRYQGKLDALVDNLFPQLSKEYREASSRAPGKEILKRVVLMDTDVSLAMSTEKREGSLAERKDAALKCLERFWPSEHAVEDGKGVGDGDGVDHFPDSDSNIDNNDDCGRSAYATATPSAGRRSKVAGKRCERSCVAFLQRTYGSHSDHVVLQNVFVNARRNHGGRSRHPQPRQKYKPPKGKEEATPGTGIIWMDPRGDSVAGAAREDGIETGYCDPSTWRFGKTSEFDAVVLRQRPSDEGDADGGGEDPSAHHAAVVESVWEAKRTLSPSALHDALTKKLHEVEALLNDESAVLAYDCAEGNKMALLPRQRLNRSWERDDSDGGGGKGGQRCDVADTEVVDNPLHPFTFGIYATELLTPESAAEAVRNIALSSTLSSDVGAVTEAIDEGTVEVKVEKAVEIVRHLRRVLVEKQGGKSWIRSGRMAAVGGMRIVLRVEGNVSFVKREGVGGDGEGHAGGDCGLSSS